MSDPVMGKLGKYELLERLAIGGMAELFKAQILGDHGFKKLVAIKKILPHLTANPAFVDMFVDEARITALLEHPSIVQVFEFGQEGGELYLVMQLVEGIDLLDLLRRGKKLGLRLPTELAVHIAHQILDALDYAHNARDQEGRPLGIIHRDVSPGNVLLSRRGNVMLTDFGIAWAYERHQKTEAGRLKGKFGYMSPEQVGGAKLDARSDIFSTGVLLAEMLINRHLFAAGSDLEVLLMVRDAQLDRLERHGGHIPAELMAILRKALARQAGRRYASAGHFREALADWLFSRGVRVAATDLAAHMARVQHALDARTRAKRDSALLGKTPAPTLSGPETRQHQLEAALAADAARAEYARRAPEPAAREDSPTRLFERVDTGNPGARADTGNPGARAPTVAIPEAVKDPGSGVADIPTERGDFAEVSPFQVLCRLADRDATGLLVAEGRAGTLKEAYFKDGHPEFVMSNVRSERLGDYLIGRGVLSAEDRDRAVKVMPHFGGHLLDTLIGLGLMDPLGALRQLGWQVRDKLVDVCIWPKGKYRWYEGRPNVWPARKLHLDTYEIMGAGALALEVPVVVTWARQIRDMRAPPLAADPRLERFGLGEGMEQARRLIDGSSTVTELAGRVQDPEARLLFLRALYLLTHCGILRLA